MSWTTGTVGRCTSMQTALFYLFSSNQSTASKFDIWEHLLTHQLVLFYMHRPSEGLQSAQGSKVMNNRQDSILNRPRIMGLRADHWPQHWKIVLKVLSKVDFFFSILFLVFVILSRRVSSLWHTYHHPAWNPPPGGWSGQAATCANTVWGRWFPWGTSHSNLCCNKKVWWKSLHICAEWINYLP